MIKITITVDDIDEADDIIELLSEVTENGRIAFPFEWEEELILDEND